MAKPTRPTPTRARKPPVRDDWCPRFLDAFEKHGTISLAARDAGVHRDTVYAEKARNPEFALDLAKRDQDIGDQLESRALHEALNGNDRLLQMMLRARKPRYGEQLRQDHVDQIRREARQAVLAELEEQIASLPAGPRNLVLEALARAAAQQEKTP